MYETRLCSQPDLMASLSELGECELVCWCSTEPCHGDLLLRFANEVGTSPCPRRCARIPGARPVSELLIVMPDGGRFA